VEENGKCGKAISNAKSVKDTSGRKKDDVV
jgi:hypothetical protein